MCVSFISMQKEFINTAGNDLPVFSDEKLEN
jgi:hypothetical protein